jgi:hypothetical protein
MFHTLNRLGLVEIVAVPEEEAVWLDRLAEGVATGSAWNGHTEVAETATDEPENTEAEVSSETETVDEAVVTEPEPIAIAPDETPRVPAELKGVSAPASTTLTDGVYDEIRRLRSRVGEK